MVVINSVKYLIHAEFSVLDQIFEVYGFQK